MIHMDDRETVPARCGTCGWSNNGRLTLVDRWLTDRPPIPRHLALIEVHRYWPGDDGSSIVECPACGEQLNTGTLNEATGKEPDRVGEER